MKLLIIGARGLLGNSEVERLEDKTFLYEQAFQALGMETRVFHHRDVTQDHLPSRIKKTANLLLDRLGAGVAFNAYSHADHRLLQTVSEFKPEHVFIFKGETLRPDLLRSLKQDHGVRTLVNMFPDNPFVYDTVMQSLELYDRFFVKDTVFVEQLKSMGAAHVDYQVHACAPKAGDTAPPSAEELALHKCDVTFVGNLYPHRMGILRKLSDLSLKLWGNPAGLDKLPADDPVRRMHQGRSIGGRERELAFSVPPCSLNTHHPLNDIHGVNDRDFDIPAAGGLLLTNGQVDLPAHFTPDKECVVYSSIDELKERAGDISAHPDRYAAIREAGYQKCLSAHTYLHRATSISESSGWR